MKHGNDKQNQGDQQRNDPRYRDMPSVSNGPLRSSPEGSHATSFGYHGQSGHDVLADGPSGQGDYGEQQGRHAQSGHGRGGSEHAVRREARGAGGSHHGKGPRNYRRSDESIADELIDRMTDHDELDATEILLLVEDGVVTLTGEVPERRMKHMAEDLAEQVRGVQDIHNRIRVDNGSSSFGPAGQAVRSGDNQVGSGFSSSGRREDPLADAGPRPGRAGTEPQRHETGTRDTRQD